MDLDALIGQLQNVRALYPNSRVFIATSSQVINTAVPGMNAGYRLPVVDGSCLGDQNGEVGSLFLVTTEVSA